MIAFRGPGDNPLVGVFEELKAPRGSPLGGDMLRALPFLNDPAKRHCPLETCDVIAGALALNGSGFWP